MKQMKRDRKNLVANVVKDAVHRELIAAKLIRNAVALGEESMRKQQTLNYLEQMKLEQENIVRALPSFVKRRAILHSKPPRKMDIQSATRDVNGERRRVWPWVSEGYLLRERLMKSRN